MLSNDSGSTQTSQDMNTTAGLSSNQVSNNDSPNGGDHYNNINGSQINGNLINNGKPLHEEHDSANENNDGEDEEEDYDEDVDDDDDDEEVGNSHDHPNLHHDGDDLTELDNESNIIRTILPSRGNKSFDLNLSHDNEYVNNFQSKLNCLNNIDKALIQVNNLNSLENELNLLSKNDLNDFNHKFNEMNLRKMFLFNKEKVLENSNAEKLLNYGLTRHNIVNNEFKYSATKLNKKKAPLAKSGKVKGTKLKSGKRKGSITSTDNDDDTKKRRRKLNSKTKVDDNDLDDLTEFDDKKGKIDGDSKSAKKSAAKEEKLVSKQYENTFISIWKDLSRKDGPKVSRLMQQSTQAKLINFKKTSILAAREAKRWQLKNNKNQKDLSSKARRAMREMFNFWKRNERIERELRKKHEKEILDKAKREEEEREAKRQSRKLNFLITQTELYSHFIGKKIKTDEFEGKDKDPTIENMKEKNGSNNYEQYSNITGEQTDFNSLDFDNEDEESLNRAAAINAQMALENAKNKADNFNDKPENDPLNNPDTNGEEMNFQNPTLMGDINITQPDMLKCSLKEYQVKGLNWLANLYEQGINGILADEMGLGKTVQSISVLAYLAETHNIWGPYLIVTPASTLHNWQQEITKFVPNFKVLPYWGNAKDRKILRKFWDRKNYRYSRDSPFHVLVTSYQLVVADAAYFQKMKWQYMILDEAQAIKSSQSSRWKSLLSFNCRNRLLLTGTPIQNSMQELWALLHFIMPSLFDSHDEFSDWFSKDIESHAQSNTQLNEQQLKRLHVILKPFMLRRIKKNVQSELGDKLEVDMFCDLTNRQKKYYQMLKSQFSIMELLESANSNDDNAQSLINLVMQFRKVCNHPDLFERADAKSSFAFSSFARTYSFMRETNDLECSYTTKNEIKYDLPRLIYDDLITPSYNNNEGSLNKIFEQFSIYDPTNVGEEDSFLNLINLSSTERRNIAKQNVLMRAINQKTYNSQNYEGANRFKYIYDGDDTDKFIPTRRSLLINDYESDHALISNSLHLKELYSVKDKVYENMNINILRPAAEPIAAAPPVDVHCNTPSFLNNLNDVLFNRVVRSSLYPLPLSTELELSKANVPVTEFPKSNMLPNTINKLIDYSGIRMPSMNRFITESGKLAKLDELLHTLKQNDHRVLIYFQMTRMMDLMEEYLTYRQHNYIRLDGSSKLDDRRDLVHDWQNKPELFVFLLSTRAGGLGINLTAADTVIFYDSDWNPTIDSQAMDRAHRLGQTKQVTVYRLLTRNTIEERMRDRAKQKEQVQQVVMEGKATMVNKKEDNQNKKKDVAYLLLGEDKSSEPGIDSPNNPPATSGKNLEDMYHEDEGQFNSTPPV